MNSRVPSMKQMVVQKRHTFAAGLKNERESRRIIFLRKIGIRRKEKQSST